MSHALANYSRRFFAFSAISCIACTTMLVDVCSAQIPFDRIGYTQLQNELGAMLPTGVSVDAALVEPGTNYLPNVTTGSLAGKTVNNVSNTSTGISGHSTGSALRLFGTTGVAPGTDNVDAYQADDWFNNHMRILSTGEPLANDYHVTSHSFIVPNQGASINSPGDVAGSSLSQAAVNDLLQRFDFANARDNTLAFVGTSNGRSTTIPAGLAPAYNAITVGRTDGNHGAGTTTDYGPGRVKVDIVAPQGTTSGATPFAASAGALLIDSAGIGTEAARNQVVRATLLAGAKKEPFQDWDRTETRPLDERYGAGELNVYNSYQMQQAGQQDGSTVAGGTLVSPNGWDYVDDFNPNESRFYTFEVGDNLQWDKVSIILAWNLNVVDTNPTPAIFTPVSSLANLNLRFLNSDGSVLDASLSSSDNVEHLYFDSLAAGTYNLEVSGDLSADYGLAWRGESVVIESAAVPEPGSGALLLLAAVGGTLLRRTNR